MKSIYHKTLRGVHIHFVSGLLFLAATLLLATAIILFTRTQPTNDVIGATQKGVISEKTLLKNHTTHYPVFYDAKLDAIIKAHVNRQVDAFEQVTKNTKDIRNHLFVNYEIQHYGSRTATVSFNRLAIVAGQPNRFSRTNLILDLVEKREVGVKDVLQQTPQARKKLAYLFHDFFKQQIGMGITPMQLVGLLELQLADIENVGFGEHEIIFSINPYDAKSKEGAATIAVARTLLKDIVNDQYVASDPNKQSVSEQSTQYRMSSQPPPGNTINPTDKLIALTFDDGPSDITPQLLDALDTYQSRATFFVLGHLASTYATTLQRIVKEGNEIGNHSWNHPNLRLLNSTGLDSQILATQSAIQTATGGYAPVLMRPPYGFTSPTVKQYLLGHNLREALWNADTNDWKDRDPQVIYDRIMSDARDGRVILIHDIHLSSVQAAIRAIRDLKAQGYQLVTLSELYKYR